jgi:hypothetical protein
VADPSTAFRALLDGRRALAALAARAVAADVLGLDLGPAR